MKGGKYIYSYWPFAFSACTPYFDYIKRRTAEWQNAGFAKNFLSNKLVYLVLCIKILLFLMQEGKSVSLERCELFSMQIFSALLEPTICLLWRNFLRYFLYLISFKFSRKVFFILNTINTWMSKFAGQVWPELKKNDLASARRSDNML